MLLEGVNSCNMGYFHGLLLMLNKTGDSILALVSLVGLYYAECRIKTIGERQWSVEFDIQPVFDIARNIFSSSALLNDFNFATAFFECGGVFI